MANDLPEEVIKTWISVSGAKAPHTPGFKTGNNDGKVRNANGFVVADCNGCEAMADVIAALLNQAVEKYLNKADI